MLDIFIRYMKAQERMPLSNKIFTADSVDKE